MPSASKASPLARASAARSRRSSARPCLPATDSSVPMVAEPARICVCATSGAEPSTGTTRVALPRPDAPSGSPPPGRRNSLGQRQAFELVEVGLVRKSFSQHVILASFRHGRAQCGAHDSRPRMQPRTMVVSPAELLLFQSRRSSAVPGEGVWDRCIQQFPRLLAAVASLLPRPRARSSLADVRLSPFARNL